MAHLCVDVANGGFLNSWENQVDDKTGNFDNRKRGSIDESADELPRRWLRIGEAADWLGVSVAFMRRLVLEQRICFYKPCKFILFDISDLDDWVRRGRKPARD